MIDESTGNRILSILNAGATAREGLWCILDGARDESIYGKVETVRRRQCCLYSGTLPWQLQVNAPYLVELYDDAFTRDLVHAAWGNSWGIFFRSESSMAVLRKHLRTFLRVVDQRGRRLIFRYYDPRVMRVYLPTCLPVELDAVFGPIRCFLMESEEADSVLRFERVNHRLETTQHAIDRQPIPQGER
ncbi:MAG TPA: DUF4123 domain-containing protein [Verrucomicrobiae bacterium]|nr:DUF4123 domain-containing protein [Verrucomicrobiae bacterium]